jgi:hypothetical protein
LLSIVQPQDRLGWSAEFDQSNRLIQIDCGHQLRYLARLGLGSSLRKKTFSFVKPASRGRS